MLDQLSGGRFELGVGRGVSPIEIEYFGFDPAKSQAMYLEAYQVISRRCAAARWTSRAATTGSRTFLFNSRRCSGRIRPSGTACRTPRAREFAADNRFNVVSNAAPKSVRVITDRLPRPMGEEGQRPDEIPFIGCAARGHRPPRTPKR